MPASLGLPEVVELEIIKHADRLGGQLRQQALEADRQMLQLLGRSEEYQAPRAEFGQAAARRIEEFSSLIVRIPFTFDHARGALQMVLDEVPPNGPKHQQFKDSAIWQGALELAGSYSVQFVTSDKGFFDRGDSNRGLARVLSEQASSTPCGLKAYHGLQAFMHMFKGQVPQLNYVEIARGIALALGDEVKQFSDAVKVDQLSKHQLRAFLTETANVLAVTFELEFAAALNRTGDGPSENITLRVVGECTVKFPSLEANDVQLKRLDAKGERLPGGGLYYQLDTIIIGARVVDYRLRAPLDG